MLGEVEPQPVEDGIELHHVRLAEAKPAGEVAAPSEIRTQLIVLCEQLRASLCWIHDLSPRKRRASQACGSALGSRRSCGTASRPRRFRASGYPSTAFTSRPRTRCLTTSTRPR